MRITQVAPLNESVPPKLYGGAERVVSYLTEELTRMGHEDCGVNVLRHEGNVQILAIKS